VRTLWPGINIWEGTCLLRFSSTIFHSIRYLVSILIKLSVFLNALYIAIFWHCVTQDRLLYLWKYSPLWLVSHPCHLILHSLWISHHCHVCIPNAPVCSEVSTAFSLPRQILYLLPCEDHLFGSFGYRLLTDTVVRASIHVCWRRLSSGFPFQKCRLSYSVVLPFPCDAVEKYVTHSLALSGYVNKTYTQTQNNTPRVQHNSTALYHC